jgi:putative ABC transport system permease protein
MSFLDILRTALFALRGNWMRSALTSLGVIIGIAAVIVMVSIGQGTQAEIDKMVSGLGSQRLDIGSAGGMSGGARSAQGSRWSLTDGDVEAIREEVPEAQYVSGNLRGGTQVVFAESNASTQWQGVQADWFTINDWKIAQGDMFQASDYGGSTKPVIIGETVRKTLFADEDGIGQTVRLGRVPFTVVGVLVSKGQGGFGQDQDDMVVVPLEVARRRLSNSQSMPPGAVQQISVGVDDAKNLTSAQSEIEGLLRQRHKIDPGAEDDFVVRNISQIVATRTATTNLMSKLLGAVAGICLIIGGIGIMNIMLVSVTERIREIAHGRWCRTPRRATTVPCRSHVDLVDRRRDWNCDWRGWGLDRRQDRQFASAIECASRDAGGSVLDRHRAVLRLLPGTQGVTTGSNRGIAPAIVVRPKRKNGCAAALLAAG